MFCYQCEQTAGGSGCTQSGVCGKNPTVAALQDLLIFGIKGVAAYAYHARELGAVNPEVDAFLEKGLFATLTNVNFDAGDFVNLALECGKANLQAMKLLNEAHVERFGKAEPTEVAIGTVAGPAILVSGHDLLALEKLLEQTEGSGVNVYTHGEMLPAHGYPRLKKHKHLVGNYGGAWQLQKSEFTEFPGAILVTTNCLMPPKDAYKDRLFVMGPVGFPDVARIDDFDFSAVIEKAKALPPLAEKADKTIMTGFQHHAVLGLADKIVGAVKAGKIRHFFLIGGCDGARPGRNYYTEFAEQVPQDCVILTLACGKYRFNKLDFGDIDGIPRLLDVGQCNDAYSAVEIALALADAFDCGVNELPLSFIISWYEQKAVSILLTLLHLGIKDIRLGPSLPAFVRPEILKVLQDNFNLMAIDEPAKDLAACLA
ncbi:MAG: hydroxylamine reductase [Anaerolineaceae bacterium]|nr:hydroxylamine reductase [Anaerolineaceae bacterium]